MQTLSKFNFLGFFAEGAVKIKVFFLIVLFFPSLCTYTASVPFLEIDLDKFDAFRCNSVKGVAMLMTDRDTSSGVVVYDRPNGIQSFLEQLPEENHFGVEDMSDLRREFYLYCSVQGDYYKIGIHWVHLRDLFKTMPYNEFVLSISKSFTLRRDIHVKGMTLEKGGFVEVEKCRGESCQIRYWRDDGTYHPECFPLASPAFSGEVSILQNPPLIAPRNTYNDICEVEFLEDAEITAYSRTEEKEVSDRKKGSMLDVNCFGNSCIYQNVDGKTYEFSPIKDGRFIVRFTGRTASCYWCY
jgi:hypothetical protein